MTCLRIFRLISSGTRISNYQKRYTVLPSLNVHSTYYEQRREMYKNFGHKPRKEALVTKLWYGFITIMMIVCSLDWRWIRMLYLVKTGQIQPKQESKIEEKPT